MGHFCSAFGALEVSDRHNFAQKAYHDTAFGIALISLPQIILQLRVFPIAALAFLCYRNNATALPY